MNHRAWLGLLVYAFALSSLGASPRVERGLFVIAGSKNANVLHYDLHLNQDGNVDPDFVKSEESGAVPRVVYVDLFGKRAKTGEPVSERLVP